MDIVRYFPAVTLTVAGASAALPGRRAISVSTAARTASVEQQLAAEIEARQLAELEREDAVSALSEARAELASERIRREKAENRLREIRRKLASLAEDVDDVSAPTPRDDDTSVPEASGPMQAADVAVPLPVVPPELEMACAQLVADRTASDTDAALMDLAHLGLSVIDTDSQRHAPVVTRSLHVEPDDIRPSG